MSEKLSPEAISRRKALSMLGLVGALGLTPATLVESEADAQEAAPAPAAPAPAPSTGGAGTPGMKRRQGRRSARHERRHARRTGQPAAPAPASTQ